MIIFYCFILLLIPLTMLGFGLSFRKHPPKTINALYGYRTNASTKSRETWDFAHKYFGRIWFYLGIVTAILSTSSLLYMRTLDTKALSFAVLLITGLQLVALIAPIVPTELALKRNFDSEGHPN